MRAIFAVLFATCSLTLGCQSSDSSSKQAEISAVPRRIVSTAPSNTEILFAVGAGNQVVGVTTFCTAPPEAKSRETIGGFAPKTISIEKIVSLKPDLVLTTGGIQDTLTQQLRELNLPVQSYDAGSLAGVRENIERLATLTGHAERGRELSATLKARQAAVEARVAKRTGRRPGVIFVVAEEPLLIAGPKTFASQLVELAGGKNLFADVSQDYPRVSDEEIVKRNPDLIVYFQSGHEERTQTPFAKRPGWNTLHAIQTQQLLSIEDDLIARVGPRLFDALELLSEKFESVKLRE